MAPSSTSTRPPSRGEFELHVQSVRAARGIPHLVQVPVQTPTTAPPHYLVPTLPSPAYRPHADDEKSSFEHDSDAGSVTVGDAKSGAGAGINSSRLTTDDGPEPNTLARGLFLYGFRTSLLSIFPLPRSAILILIIHSDATLLVHRRLYPLPRPPIPPNTRRSRRGRPHTRRTGSGPSRPAPRRSSLGMAIALRTRRSRPHRGHRIARMGRCDGQVHGYPLGFHCLLGCDDDYLYKRLSYVLNMTTISLPLPQGIRC